jgi:hypothetical protein
MSDLIPTGLLKEGVKVGDTGYWILDTGYWILDFKNFVKNHCL